MTPPSQYVNKLIAFVDIIGFKNIIDRHGERAISMIVDGIENSLNRYRGHWQSDDDEPDMDIMGYPILNINDPTYYLLSDSIVFTMEDSENNLIRFFSAISHLQKTFIESGLFLRGGITKGKIFEKATLLNGNGKELREKGSIVFGPGIIEAFKLESEVASWPRIVLAKKLVQVLKEKVDLAKSLSQPAHRFLNQFVLGDNNGEYFLDYLSITGFPSVKTDGFLATHKRRILKELGDADKHKVKGKYLSLLQYHNFIIKLFFSYGETDLFIGPSIGIRLLPERFLYRPFERVRSTCSCKNRMIEGICRVIYRSSVHYHI